MTARLMIFDAESRPMRLLVSAVLINAIGTGLFMACGTLYFVRSIGLSAHEVGTGLTVGGLVGLILSLLVGVLADRIGLRVAYAGLLALQGVGTTLFLVTQSFGVFIGVATLTAIGEKAARPVGNALVAQVAGERRSTARAYMRSANNLGMALGALLGAPALAIGTTNAYGTLLVVDVATFMLAAGAALLLPTMPRAAATTERRLPAWTDGRYLAVTLLNGVLSIQYFVLPYGIPLWIVLHTTAPRWSISLLLVVNSVLIVAFQVWASRGVDTVDQAAHRIRLAAGIFLIACLLFAASSGVSSVFATFALVLGVLMLTAGELWHAAGMFQLSVGLAAPHVHAQYQTVFNLGVGGAEALAPLVLTTLCISIGQVGWLTLGALWLAAGVMMPIVTSWAARNRSSILR